MTRAAGLASRLLLAGCASDPPLGRHGLPEKVFEMPVLAPCVRRRRWSEVLACAEALPAGRDAEKRLALLAELYRQGHNMDVQGAAEKSAASIEQCLDAVPASRACHLTASFLYLSVRPTPEHLALAERSLSVLREQALPGHSDDAEAGYVFLYVYRQDPARARMADRALPRALPHHRARRHLPQDPRPPRRRDPVRRGLTRVRATASSGTR